MVSGFIEEELVLVWYMECNRAIDEINRTLGCVTLQYGTED